MTYQVHYTGKFYKGLTRDMQSPSHTTKITYEVGKAYDADGFEVSDDDCGPGIHVVTSLALALKWGPVVVEVSIPDGATIVWSKDKLRTSQVRVLRVADLSGANLSGANLYGADLREANLRGADLFGADLTGADLFGADLFGANLYGANLSGANLYGADLGGADLSGAYLSGADLSGANLREANLAESIGYLKIIGEPASLPTGWRYDKGLVIPGPDAS